MPTHEIQLAFWTSLKRTNPELFNGNPQGAHYFDIKISGVSPIMLRLNIYLCEEDYVEKGVQTIAIVVPYAFRRSLNDLSEEDSEVIHNDFIVYRAKNACLEDPITEDQTKWQPYIDWFIKYTQKLKNLLGTWE